MCRKVFVVLLHALIVNRDGKEVVTAVTNLDIHDIARTCKTYGVSRYFIVNPEVEQEKMVKSILDHWSSEVSKNYHPTRASALELVRFAYTFEEAYNEAFRMACEWNPRTKKPFVVMPDARNLEEESWSYDQLRLRLKAGRLDDEDDGTKPLVIVYGTGWGIHPKFFDKVDRILKPIKAAPNAVNNESRYVHLSVRAASAIVLDRLFGE